MFQLNAIDDIMRKQKEQKQKRLKEKIINFVIQNSLAIMLFGIFGGLAIVFLGLIANAQALLLLVLGEISEANLFVNIASILAPISLGLILIGALGTIIFIKKNW